MAHLTYFNPFVGVPKVQSGISLIPVADCKNCVHIANEKIETGFWWSTLLTYFHI